MGSQRILITDADTRQALAATRSLGRAGHEVITLAEHLPSLAGASRHCALARSGPAPVRDSVAFVDTVVALVREHRIDCVLPMTEISTLLLTASRDRLPGNCKVPFAAHDAVRRAANKADVLQLAQSIGVPIPATTILRTAADGLVAGSLPYPVVVKPACSRVQLASGWLANSVSYATDEASLQRRLQEIAPESFPVLLQERIVGPGVGVFMLLDHGRLVAQFAHRRIREKPPSGGVSVLCESTPVDQEAARHALALLIHIDWHGPAMVEFKRDLRDGTLRLMEINGRFWGSLQLSIDAGVDFPRLLLDSGNPREAESVPPYRSGVRSRWLGGDLDALLISTLKNRSLQNLPPDYPGRIKCLWNFLHCSGAEVHLEIERRDDPGPALLEWKRRIGAA